MILRTLRPALVLLGVFLVTPLAAAPPGGPSSSFRVTGEVTKRTSFDLEALEALPVTKENVTYFAAGAVVTQSFTGTLLWDLLQSVGIVVDSKIKNDILRKIVIVTGSDGYRSVFGAGEIAPTFGGAQIMVAYAADGQPLGTDGFARIVAPGDKAGGRFVSNIVKIEVQDAGE
jgi:DMSO/TMAO reductase YedYZ molybdopterin-dependent catalytic subunit